MFNQSFLLNVLSKNYNIFLLPCENDFFVLEYQRSLYRCLLLKVNFLSKKGFFLDLSYLANKYSNLNTLWSLSQIELFLCYNLKHDKLWLLTPEDVLKYKFLTLSEKKYNEKLLPSNISFSRSNDLSSNDEDFSLDNSLISKLDSLSSSVSSNDSPNQNLSNQNPEQK